MSTELERKKGEQMPLFLLQFNHLSLFLFLFVIDSLNFERILVPELLTVAQPSTVVVAEPLTGANNKKVAKS